VLPASSNLDICYSISIMKCVNVFCLAFPVTVRVHALQLKIKSAASSSVKMDAVDRLDLIDNLFTQICLSEPGSSNPAWRAAMDQAISATGVESKPISATGVESQPSRAEQKEKLKSQIDEIKQKYEDMGKTVADLGDESEKKNAIEKYNQRAQEKVQPLLDQIASLNRAEAIDRLELMAEETDDEATTRFFQAEARHLDDSRAAVCKCAKALKKCVQSTAKCIESTSERATKVAAFTVSLMTFCEGLRSHFVVTKICEVGKVLFVLKTSTVAIVGAIVIVASGVIIIKCRSDHSEGHVRLIPNSHVRFGEAQQQAEELAGSASQALERVKEVSQKCTEGAKKLGDACKTASATIVSALGFLRNRQPAPSPA